LHVVRPMGFFLADRHFKRAGMDYVGQVAITIHDDLAGLMAALGKEPFVLTSGLAGRPLWSAQLAANTWIMMGKESAGLPAELLAKYPERTIQIPMREGTRGLNVSTAAGIVVYEALRRNAGP